MEISLSENTADSLLLISGISWSITYIVLIIYGFKFKTYGMPLVAMAFNITWEGLYGFTNLTYPPNSQHIINITWFCLDLVMVYQYFTFGRTFFSKKLSPKLFLPWSISIFLIALTLQLAFLLNFNFDNGPGYSSFLINLVMSFLFIDQLLRRNGSQKIPMSVAVLKCLGTLAATIGVSLVERSHDQNSANSWAFILIIGLVCFVLDVMYILLLSQQKKKRDSIPEMK